MYVCTYIYILYVFSGGENDMMECILTRIACSPLVYIAHMLFHRYQRVVYLEEPACYEAPPPRCPLARLYILLFEGVTDKAIEAAYLCQQVLSLLLRVS